MRRRAFLCRHETIALTAIVSPRFSTIASIPGGRRLSKRLDVSPTDRDHDTLMHDEAPSSI
jgi:hypothetical protein